MNDPVDVLIIGAGASGAAVAWSLAETKMHILCLEQGGWMNPAAYPSTGRDWEARFFRSHHQDRWRIAGEPRLRKWQPARDGSRLHLRNRHIRPRRG